MITTLELNNAMDAVAWTTLRSVGQIDPPFVPEAVARGIATGVVEAQRLPCRGRLTHRYGEPTIFVRPDDRPEREHWAIAHEIGELFVGAVLRRADYEEDFATDTLREHIASGVGNRILLPNPVFQSVFAACRGDLFRLKEHFVTASHEVIAMRSLDLEERAIVTVVDNGKITRRRANFPTQLHSRLSSQESACLRLCQDDGCPATFDRDGVLVRCWPVYEDGNPIKREIIRATQCEWD